jgi:hypothetical protein
MPRRETARSVARRGLLPGLTLLLGLLVAVADAAPASMKSEESRMWMTVGERRFAITLNDNEAARAFRAMLPLTLDMPDLNGNEKHVDLPKARMRAGRERSVVATSCCTDRGL